MRVNFPTDLLRSFVTIVDTGSMARASEHVFLTQSALSLQMKRLADMVQQPIFRRHQGTTTLTQAGETLLRYAREILSLNDSLINEIGGRLVEPVRIGMVQDFADAILSRVLTRFKRLSPEIRMEIRVGSSTELRELISSDLLDIVLYIGSADESGAITTAPTLWLGDPDLLAEAILPVAVMTKPCLFRDASIEALEANKRAYNIAMETPSISALRAAVQSGLAITCRTSAFLVQYVAPLALDVIQLAPVSYNISVRASAHPTIQNLAELIRNEVEIL
jgi:DNA-binding transcriptional LysR family regulator